MLTIATHRGLYQVNRLAFGASTALAIFQRCIDSLFKGIPNVVVPLDDILLAAPINIELLDLEDKVLGRLSEAGLRLKFTKCEFGVPTVHCFGHEVSAAGLRPLPERVADLLEAPSPQTVLQLGSFWGKMPSNDRFVTPEPGSVPPVRPDRGHALGVEGRARGQTPPS